MQWRYHWDVDDRPDTSQVHHSLCFPSFLRFILFVCRMSRRFRWRVAVRATRAASNMIVSWQSRRSEGHDFGMTEVLCCVRRCYEGLRTRRPWMAVRETSIQKLSRRISRSGRDALHGVVTWRHEFAVTATIFCRQLVVRQNRVER